MRLQELESAGLTEELTSEILGLHFLGYTIESTDIRIVQPQTSFGVKFYNSKSIFINSMGKISI